MSMLVAFVGWIVVRYSASYLDGEARQGAFLGWMLATLAAVLLLVQAGNLAHFVLAWIATSLCLHRLLLFYGDRVQARRAARKKYIIARIGDVALICAALLLYSGYGTLDIAAILSAARDGEGPAVAVWAAGLLALAAMLKSAQFPAHGWLTEVMETPTPVSALLHAGVINGGGFLLIRFADVMLLAPGVLAVLVMIGGFTALFGGLAMLSQSGVKTSLAWSTIAQMGFMTMQCGLGLFSLALLHIVAHSLYKAHAFLISGTAVDLVASLRRPGPIAIPNGRAVLRAFALALTIYAVIGFAFGFDAKSPQAIALGAILIFGVAYLLAQGLADTAPRVLTRRTALYAIGASVSYFALQSAAEWLAEGTLPTIPAPGALEWGLIVLALLSFGFVAVAQAMFPLWSDHPAAAGLRVHLTNGLYANALFDRLINNGSTGGPPPASQEIRRDRNSGPTVDITGDALQSAADRAARQIPPLWPLASSVAVNPFLGQTTQTLAETGAQLARMSGTPVTMKRSWYRDRIAAGTIRQEDLAASLEASPHADRPADLKALNTAIACERPLPGTLPTIAELAARATGVDWPGIMADRFGLWAGGYFDQGQALWAAPRGRSAWSAWCAYATQDLTPEIMGLKGFAAFVANAPERPGEAIARAARRLGLTEAGLDSYFHQLLLSLGGWAQYARYELWRAELAGGADAALTDMLAIRLLWEEALLTQHEAAIGREWAAVCRVHEMPVLPMQDDVIDEILQEAAERAAQRDLAGMFRNVAPRAAKTRPAMQAAFCIDVRSEVFRRALEAVSPSVQTLGFAGFFGIFTKHRRSASDVEEHRLPVLLNPAVTSMSGAEDGAADDLAARYKARAKRAWGRFKLAAVSSFAFVEAMGPVYIGKLLRDGLSLSRHPVPIEPAPRFVPDLDLESRITAAETVLRAMSLTAGFARIVLLVGHGARVVNNPHASGLQCGACGGYSGDVNVRLLAGLLNDPEVRSGLAERGIVLPANTLFIGALHDTATDEVTIYDDDVAAANHTSDLKDTRRWLEAAGKLVRGERALRLPRAGDERDIAKRARNWAEVRPEWGLAGCRAFIAAPRSRTVGRDLEGRAFLHDYDWRQDQERRFAVLELIMTAPVVVASWISLQYYGSTVAPEMFGAGNKLLHNVVGGIGVFEGNGGLLRAGLPWQSIHDGEKYIHDPLRLSVCIEAPREAMSDILSRHEGVRALFDNRWLHLFAFDEQGRLAWRYAGGLEWEPVETETRSVRLEAVA